MIKILHTNKPATLITNEAAWTSELLALVKKHGRYENIPEKEKISALRHYKDPTFTKDIFSLTNYKCTFCESNIDNVSDIHVEHFFPKSLYPKMAFKWTNLLPACERCNRQKGNFDTKSLPFVNPMIDNPDDFFDYKDCRIQISPTAPNRSKAKNTIEACDLKRVGLIRIYSALLPIIHEVSNKTEEAIKHFNKLTQKGPKIKILRNMLESMENLIAQSKPGSQHSSFIRCMILRDTVFIEAINMINIHRTDLGLAEALTVV
jgi:uncharacterized protein (TIGR02646 family)